jgi:streptogramin lyase
MCILLPIVTVGVWVVPWSSVSADSTVTTTYPLPDAPFDIKVENSNRIWFSLPSANSIGSLTLDATGNVTYTAYALPSPNSEPYRLAVSGGSVWFTQRMGNRIGRISTVDGSITEYEVPTLDSAPTGIDVARDGRVWFVQSKSNKLAVLSPSTGAITEVSVNHSGAALDRINAQSSGFIWITAPGINKLLAYRPDNNQILDILVDDNAGMPGTIQALAVTSSGSPRVSTASPAKIGTYIYGTLAFWLWYRYNPETANFVDFVISTNAGQSLLWGIDSANRQAFQFDASSFLAYHTVRLGSDESTLSSISLDRTTGVLWIADAGASALYAWSPPYSLKTYLPTVAR